mmetsp:Transcript_104902/g.301611  ORF Transcript_104902/g.301611 Transcript_104902/m.301611 type:complete len:320 (+) Transcript_104902:900-1859(+)
MRRRCAAGGRSGRRGCGRCLSGTATQRRRSMAQSSGRVTSPTCSRYRGRTLWRPSSTFICSAAALPTLWRSFVFGSIPLAATLFHEPLGRGFSESGAGSSTSWTHSSARSWTTSVPEYTAPSRLGARPELLVTTHWHHRSRPSWPGWTTTVAVWLRDPLVVHLHRQGRTRHPCRALLGRPLCRSPSRGSHSRIPAPTTGTWPFRRLTSTCARAPLQSKATLRARPASTRSQRGTPSWSSCAVSVVHRGRPPPRARRACRRLPSWRWAAAGRPRPPRPQSNVSPSSTTSPCASGRCVLSAAASLARTGPSFSASSAATWP